MKIFINKDSQILAISKLIANKIHWRVIPFQCPVYCLFVEIDSLGFRLAGSESIQIIQAHGVQAGLS